jgi:hypothetical protein
MSVYYIEKEIIMKVKLKYLGFIVVDEVYQGKDTVDLVVTDQQARKLATLISLISKQRHKFNFKLKLRPGKDQTYVLAVASTAHEAAALEHHPPAGQLDFLPEGYRIRWSNRGLEVQTTDYHPGTMVMPWKLILDLAQASNHDTEIID